MVNTYRRHSRKGGRKGASPEPSAASPEVSTAPKHAPLMLRVVRKPQSARVDSDASTPLTLQKRKSVSEDTSGKDSSRKKHAAANKAKKPDVSMHTAQTPQASDQTRSSDHQNTLSSPKIASDDQILCSSESTSNSHILLSKIRALASNLPSTVELGTTANSWASLFVGTGAIDKDYIAAFGLMAEPDPDEDWEVCNRSIHKCFDYGITKEDLATRIVRGPMGVLALCGFLDFMKKRNVDFAPLHERLVLLSEALYERGARLPENWAAKMPRSDWADPDVPAACSPPSHSFSPYDDDDDDVDAEGEIIPPNIPPAMSSSTYRKKPTLDFTSNDGPHVAVPKRSKKISPFDDTDPEYDYGIFGFDRYDPLPARSEQQSYNKGPLSNEDLAVLAEVSRKFENHIRYLSGPDQLNHPVSFIKSALFQLSSINSDKQTSAYNAFIHDYRQKSTAQGNAFLTEAAAAWNQFKSQYADDKTVWDAKRSELVEKCQKDKMEILGTANQWNEGHASLMENMIKGISQQARIAGEHDIHIATFVVSGRSFSTAAMGQNKAIFGTPEAKSWFLSKLRPPDAAHDDKLALRLIFSDFFTAIAQFRKDSVSADAVKARTAMEIRDANLRKRDSASGAVADEFRKLMNAAGIKTDQYQFKFPWSSFWFILFQHSLCLRNWLPKGDTSSFRNAHRFDSKVKSEWCVLLQQFKVEGDVSSNPVLIPKQHGTDDLPNAIVLATDVNGKPCVTGDMIPAIVNGGRPKRNVPSKSKLRQEVTPVISNPNSSSSSPVANASSLPTSSSSTNTNPFATSFISNLNSSSSPVANASLLPTSSSTNTNPFATSFISNPNSSSSPVANASSFPTSSSFININPFATSFISNSLSSLPVTNTSVPFTNTTSLAYNANSTSLSSSSHITNANASSTSHVVDPNPFFTSYFTDSCTPSSLPFSSNGYGHESNLTSDASQSLPGCTPMPLPYGLNWGDLGAPMDLDVLPEGAA